jgi:tetratricopeptide (TPR) repeat protein
MKILSAVIPKALVASVVLSVPAAALAQLDASQVRGTVVDTEGKPLAGVAVEMEFKGESRAKIVRTAQTDKKGSFVRVGMKAGDWTLTFRKDGFKTVGLNTYLSMGGLSEIPPVTLEVAAPDPAAQQAAANAAAAAEAAKAASASAADAKRLGEAYANALSTMQAGLHAEAEAQFKAVVAELPNLAEAHYNLGYLAMQRNSPDEAAAAFRKTIELQPGSGEARIALARLLVAQGKGDEALALLKEKAADHAQDGRYQYALGATAFDLGKNAEAEPAFLKAAELDPSNAESLFFLGSIALGSNDVPGAVKHLQKFVSVAPATSPNLETAKALLATLKKK